MIVSTQPIGILHPRDREGFVMWRAKFSSVDFCLPSSLVQRVYADAAMARRML